MATDPKITIEEAYEVFKNPAAIDSIPFKSQGFVKSLLAGKAKYGSNSPKQQHWVRVYAEQAQKAINPAGINVTVGGAKAAPVPQVLSAIIVGEQLYGMLKKAEDFVFAKGGKKRPQIKFKPSELSPNTPEIGFKIAGASSKFKNQVMVTSGGQYGQSHYYGRIESGIYHPAPKATPAVIEFVVGFAQEPHKMGSAYGLATFHCCYCGKGIDTVDSKVMGYGPVCASKFGLPWGKKATKAAGIVGHSHNPTIKKGAYTVGVDLAAPVKYASKPSKWIEMNDAVQQMEKLAKATGTPAVTSVQGFSKAVAATGLSEPFEEEEVSLFPNQPDLAAEATQAIEMAAPPVVAQDFGFTCEVCMDTGKDITPEGMLVDCGGCK
jgi:hypothetical protein